MAGTAKKIGTADDYLNSICEQIQLTDTQFNTAVRRYKAVGKHLTKGLARQVVARMFPQKSMLSATIRPMRKDKEVVPFDLDSVCRCDANETTTSQSLYGKIETAQVGLGLQQARHASEVLRLTTRMMTSGCSSVQGPDR